MFKRILKRVFTFVFAVLVILLGYWFSGPLYRKWVVYPRMEQARQAIWDSYRKPDTVIPLSEFTGVTHAHSAWSHDSRGSLREILEGAKEAELDFIFFADHAHDKMDTFPRSFYGVYEGILFEAGTETSGSFGGGMMLTPLRQGVFNLGVSEDSLIRQVTSQGGLVTYVHSEKEHDWDNPDYQAMEIYNIHTDLLDEDGLLPFLLNHLINGERYRHWSYRELYDKQQGILDKWDRVNQTRKVTGVGSVDAHNNQNIRARYLEDGRVEWVGNNAKTLSIREPGVLEKILLSEPDENGWAFKWELDTYFHSFNFVNNHVFTSALSSKEIKEGIERGNAFVVFESLAKGEGFQYYALNDQNEPAGILGDSISVQVVDQLKVLSPFPARYRMIRDGELVLETEERSYEFEFSPNNERGNYRVEADLRLDGQWVNWIFTNPIYLY
jgi:hypothetical protein